MMQLLLNKCYFFLWAINFLTDRQTCHSTFDQFVTAVHVLEERYKPYHKIPVRMNHLVLSDISVHEIRMLISWTDRILWGRQLLSWYKQPLRSFHFDNLFEHEKQTLILENNDQTALHYCLAAICSTISYLIISVLWKLDMIIRLWNIHHIQQRVRSMEPFPSVVNDPVFDKISNNKISML